MKCNTEFIERVTKWFVAELETQLEEQPGAKIAEIEGTMREMLREVGAHALANYLTEQDEGYPEPEIPCSCGGTATYQFRRSVQTLSVVGLAS